MSRIFRFVAVARAACLYLVIGATLTGCNHPATRAPQTTPMPRAAPMPVRGLYLTGYSAGNDRKFAQTIRFMKRSGLNAMVIDAKDDSGYISWMTGITLAGEIGANTHKIKDVRSRIRKLLAAGIYPIARVVVFADPLLGRQRPQWSIRLKSGAPFHDDRAIAWPSPHQQEVWRYNVEIAKEAARCGFAEIQFDYVRFPETPIDGVNFNVPNGQLTQAIEQFLTYARRELEPLGVWVSADVFGSIVTSRGAGPTSIIGQNYARIAAIVDTICPMVYPSHFAPGCYGVSDPNQHPDIIVRGALRDARRLTPHISSAKHRPWIQDFDLGKDYTAADVEAQIKGLAQAGIHQWLLWNARNRYTPGVRYGIADRPRSQSQPAN